MGGVMWRQFAGTSQRLPPRNKRMGLALDLQRRREGLQQHKAQPSPPKPQPRMAAGPAIRGAEPQISSDSIGVVSSAVEFLEPKSPLRTMLCYRRAKPTVEKTFADLAPARSGMRPRRKRRVGRAVLSEAKRSGSLGHS